jgi:phage-related protein
MSLLSTLEDRILNALSPIIGPIKAIVSLVTNFWQTTTSLLSDAEALIGSILTEYNEIKNFKSRPAWKNRVISVPNAIDNITKLAQIPSEIANAIKDLVAQIKGRVTGGASDVEDLASDVEGLEDLRGLFAKLGPKVLRIFEKVLGVLQILADTISTISATIHDLQTIVDDIKTVRQDLENLDGLFLTQRNTREGVTLKNGKKLRLRIGSLHKTLL